MQRHPGENTLDSTLCLTDVFKPAIHTFFTHGNKKHVPILANDYVIFAFLKFVEVCKRQKKGLLKNLFNDETTVTSTLTKSTDAAQNISLICLI